MAEDERLLLENVIHLGVPETSKAGNLNIGNQLGMGIQIPTLDAATPLVFPPAVVVVLQTPTMYDSKPEIGKMMKNIMECHAKSVSGIDFGYTLETADTPVGHDGQVMAVPTKTKRSAVNPTFTFTEVTGNLVWNLFRQWIWDIQHPDTNASFAEMELYDRVPGDSTKYVYTMSTYALSMLVIQFDPTMVPANIIDAAFYTNMFPTATGDLGLERTIATSKTMERSISFTGIVQHNTHVRRIAREVATALNLRRAQYAVSVSNPNSVSNILDATGLAAELAVADTWQEASDSHNAAAGTGAA